MDTSRREPFFAASLLLRRSESPPPPTLEGGNAFTLCGCRVPRAALLGKCGSVALAVTLYAVYPVLLHAAMFVLVAATVRCEAQWLQSLRRHAQQSNHSHTAAATRERGVALPVWAAASVACAALHSL